MTSKSVTLTTTQQMNTLSAKKTKSKKAIRYVLVDPFPRYWPQLNEEQTQHLCKLLRDIQTANPQWFTEKGEKCIYFGLKESVKKLETGDMQLFVISADIKPRYVANQIILLALAGNQRIRILCIPNMESVLRPILNFSCHAFVINTQGWSQLSDFDKWTADLINDQFPVSDVIEAHFGKRTNENPMEVDDCETKPLTKCNSIEEQVELDRIYLKRENNESKQRAFVPKNAINLKPISFELEAINKIKSDFISLDTYDSGGEPLSSFGSNYRNKLSKKLKKKKKTPLVLYRELKVEKVESNPNKVKKVRNKKNKKK